MGIRELLPRIAPYRSIAQRRKYNLGRQENWEPRARAAVQLWMDNEHLRPATKSPLRVADFGAGNERLHRILTEKLSYPIDYHPYDLLPQQPTTTFHDVRRGLPDEQFDLVFCLGLLEYIQSDNLLITHLSQRCSFVMMSYVMFQQDIHSITERKAHGWIRHQTADALEANFTEAGFALISTAELYDGVSRLWLWQRA